MGKCALASQIDMKYCLGLSDAGSDVVVLLARLQGPRERTLKEGKNEGMSHEKVLIVEDEENERTGLAELVSSWGYRAETARDGVEGLDKAEQWTPSIVITDMKMPRMGGIELLAKLGEQTQAMAVILVTAQGTILVPKGPGIGYNVFDKRLAKYCVRREYVLS